MKTVLFILAIQSAILTCALAQSFQNITGRVIDLETKRPLVNANVMILEAGPITGVTTNEEGYFTIEDVGMGRYNVLISYTGYESYIMKEVLCEAGKEVYLDIGMNESVVNLEGISFANVSKDKMVNTMAGVSARSFTVEETEKYAGSWGDPARMAANYAGVATNSDIYNYIVIRGNSPNGLIWRMEGIPIPNPNHWDYPGQTGGPISIINNKLLAQSDFLSGAFPAEYTNGTSGVFDLRLRNGNSNKYEHVIELGLLALEAGSEGPFSKNSKASYLFNYRRSMLGLVDELLWVTALPHYQDLSFKLNFPLKKGNLSVFGMGGISSISEARGDSAFASNPSSDLNERTGSGTGVMGIRYVHFFSDDTRIVSNLALSITRPWERLDSIVDGEFTKLVGEERFKQDRLLVSSKLIKKFNARNVATLGISLEDHFVEYYERYESIIYENAGGDSLVLLPPWISKENHLLVFQSYMEWKHRFNNNLTWYGGLNYTHFFMNHSSALEPRSSLRWRFRENQSLSIGYGLHSQLQPFFYYLLKTPLSDDLWDRDHYSETNRELGFTKSHHFSMGYDYSISTNLRFKAEVYHQILFDVPVESRESPLSLINVGAGDEFPSIDSLVNNGTGRNSGIELTLEKFLGNRYYFLTTASILDSKYKGSDGVSRNTTYNIHFNLNALVGYELPVGKRSSININLRTVAAGGRRVVPHDEQRTIEEGKDVYKIDEAYELQLADYYRIDARVGYKLNNRKALHEIAVDLTNITNRPNEFARIYNPGKNQIETRLQQGFFFIAYYSVKF